MLSNKSYLIRAFYDWIVDSDCTPLLIINTTFPHCHVPEDFIEDNQINLNVSPQSIRDFRITRDVIDFKASFAGVVHLISAPIKAVLAVYAEENGQGMFFDFEEPEASDWDAAPGDQTVTAFPGTEKGVSHLRLVESNTEE